MNAAGIILAAGRGARMKELTDDCPKCMIKLSGETLLHWQLHALRSAGIKDVIVVRGYAAKCIQGSFETTENPRWADTNMVSTLLCADGFAKNVFSGGGERVVVSYSDIVYHSKHVRKLLDNDASIAVTFDTEWEALWRLRFSDPLTDAEIFRQKNGLLQAIGGKARSLAEIQGQYMGLLAFDHSGWQTFTKCCVELGDRLDTLDMTSFLRFLLGQGVQIGAVPVVGKWCEADSGTDIDRYENALAQGNWIHDWRH